MHERWYWTMGTFAAVVAIGGLYDHSRLIVILAGACAVFLYWASWRYGKRD